MGAKQSSAAHQSLNGKSLSYDNQWENGVSIEPCVPLCVREGRQKKKGPGLVTITFLVGEERTDCTEMCACCGGSPLFKLCLTTRGHAAPVQIGLVPVRSAVLWAAPPPPLCRLGFVSLFFEKTVLLWFPCSSSTAGRMLINVQAFVVCSAQGESCSDGSCLTDTTATITPNTNDCVSVEQPHWKTRVV